jgi:hypothetical protein
MSGEELECAQSVLGQFFLENATSNPKHMCFSQAPPGFDTASSEDVGVREGAAFSQAILLP